MHSKSKLDPSYNPSTGGEQCIVSIVSIVTHTPHITYGGRSTDPNLSMHDSTKAKWTEPHPQRWVFWGKLDGIYFVRMGLGAAGEPGTYIPSELTVDPGNHHICG